MWIDHVTLVVRDFDSLDSVWSFLKLELRPATPLFPGTERKLVPLDNTVLELLRLTDPWEAKRTLWGRGFLRFLRGGDGIFRLVLGVPDLDQFIRERRAVGIHYWPPIEETLTGLEPDAFAIRLTEVDMMMPSVMEYVTSARILTSCHSRLASITVQSDNPESTAMHYRLSLGQPIGFGHTMVLCHAAIHFRAGPTRGYSGFVLVNGARSVEVTVAGGQLLPTFSG